MVVTAGLTLVVPLKHGLAPTPWSMLHVVAFTIPLHARVDADPRAIVVGLAVNVPIAGAGETVTVTVLVAVPLGPVAVNV